MKRLAIPPLDRWDWSNPHSIGINLVEAFSKHADGRDSSPYWQDDSIARRVVYRVGSFALTKNVTERFLGGFREQRSGSGRFSRDIFVVLQKVAVQEIRNFECSTATIKKHAAAMRAAHQWDINWHYYDLVLAGLSLSKFSQAGLSSGKMPSRAAGLTNAVQNISDLRS